MKTEEIIKAVKACLPSRRPIEHHEPFIHKKKVAYELSNCIASGITSYEYVDRFEDWLANLTGAEYIVCTNTGTAALHLALVAAGVRHGEEVIIPTSTFVATANAVSHAGAVPHFVDGAPTIDPESLGAYLSKICKKGHNGRGAFHERSNSTISAIIVVHLLGIPADMVGICKVAKELNLIVIEDCSQALGVKLNGRHVGTFGWAGTFSFNNNKVLTTNGGGAVITNSSNIAYDARQLASTYRRPHQWLVEHESMAWNYRMGNINAALGIAQAKEWPAIMDAKRALAARYRHHLDGVDFLDPAPSSESNYWLNTILVDNRDELLEALHKEGLRARASFTPLNTLPFYKYTLADLYSYQYSINQEQMPRAQEFFEKAVCLPSGSSLL